MTKEIPTGVPVSDQAAELPAPTATLKGETYTYEAGEEDRPDTWIGTLWPATPQRTFLAVFRSSNRSLVIVSRNPKFWTRDEEADTLAQLNLPD